MRGTAAAMLGVLGFLWASAAPAAPVEVRLKPVDGGIEANFTLSDPAPSVAFSEPAAVVRGDAWRVLTPGVDLNNGVVARTDGAPLKSFTVRITPDTAPRDRTYPGLTRVGEGWQLYGPYLFVKGMETRADLALPADWTAAPGPTHNLDPQGYLYLGPKAYVVSGASTVIASPEISPALRQTIAKAAEQATTSYGQRLGLKLPFRPTIVIARAPQFKGGWQGDTTDGPMVSLRFFGAGWDEPNARQTSAVVRFVYHEFFHLWNARLARSRDGNKEAWLHEGMAEYAALVVSAADGATDEATVRTELGEHLSRCAKDLRRGLKQDPPRAGQLVYDCGVLAEWLADLDARAAGKDVFADWRAMFAPDAGGARQYDADRLVKVAAGDKADDPLRRLVDTYGPVDWDALMAAMNARGAEVSKTRTPANDRIALIWGLERPVCAQGSIGYYTEKEYVKLDTGDRCGPLNGDPRIDTVAGINLMTDPSGAFDAAQALCTAGKEVPLALGDKAVATVLCKAPLPPLPAWAVTKR